MTSKRSPLAAEIRSNDDAAPGPADAPPREIPTDLRPQGINERRFPRVYLHAPGTALSKVLGARGGWSGNSELAVGDLSYTGVAFLRSSQSHGPHSFQERDRVELLLHLAGERHPVKAQAMLVRSTDQAVAFEFRPLSTETRQAIERFLQAKLIGLHLRPVAREHYRSTELMEGLTHWFQGPANTNVLLWFEALTLKKAIVEVSGDWLQWSAGAGRGQLQERADATAGPLRDSAVRALHGLSPFVSRVVDILAHVPDEEKVLLPLIRALTATP